ncbi:MAG: ABC transporter permease, partial [Candidatus Tectomicrobia bacterium]
MARHTLNSIDTQFPEASEAAAPTVLQRLLSKMWQLRLGVVGGLILLGLVSLAVFAPVVAGHDPFEQNILARLKVPAFLAGGSAEHLLGTDQLGRDMFSRIIYGARISLIIGVSAVVVS